MLGTLMASINLPPSFSNTSTQTTQPPVSGAGGAAVPTSAQPPTPNPFVARPPWTGAGGPAVPTAAQPVTTPPTPNPVVARKKQGIPAGLVVQRGPWKETTRDKLRLHQQMGGLSNKSYFANYMERHSRMNDTQPTSDNSYIHHPDKNMYIRADIHHGCMANEYWDEKTQSCRRKPAKYTETRPKALKMTE